MSQIYHLTVTFPTGTPETRRLKNKIIGVFHDHHCKHAEPGDARGKVRYSLSACFTNRSQVEAAALSVRRLIFESVSQEYAEEFFFMVGSDRVIFGECPNGSDLQYQDVGEWLFGMMNDLRETCGLDQNPEADAKLLKAVGHGQ